MYNEIDDSWIEIHFYNRHNFYIKKIIIEKLDYSNEILIDKNFMGNLESYGTFYVYHRTNKNINEDIISNRCYIGYSQYNNLFSFVHGNCYSQYLNNKTGKINKDIVQISIRKNQIYNIQKYFDNYDKLELAFVNPTQNKLSFTINNEFYRLAGGESKIIKIKDTSSIIIKSNCLFFRPTIFFYKNNYLDVHHS